MSGMSPEEVAAAARNRPNRSLPDDTILNDRRMHSLSKPDVARAIKHQKHTILGIEIPASVSKVAEGIKTDIDELRQATLGGQAANSLNKSALGKMFLNAVSGGEPADHGNKSPSCNKSPPSGDCRTR